MVVQISFPRTPTLQNVFHCKNFPVSKSKTITEETHLNNFWPLKENLSRKILHDNIFQQLTGVPD